MNMCWANRHNILLHTAETSTIQVNRSSYTKAILLRFSSRFSIISMRQYDEIWISNALILWHWIMYYLLNIVWINAWLNLLLLRWKSIQCLLCSVDSFLFAMIKAYVTLNVICKFILFIFPFTSGLCFLNEIPFSKGIIMMKHRIARRLCENLSINWFVWLK